MADDVKTDADEGIEESKMPLLEHLIELRTRLMRSVVAVLVLFFISYYFSQDIYEFLGQPLVDAFASQGLTGRRFIFTAPHEAFFTYIKVSFFAALFIGFPYISAQIWMFVAPGLYQHEKKAFLPFLVMTPVLFFLGGAMAYYFVFPMAWKFFISFETAGAAGHMAVQLETKVSEYLSLVMQLIFAFGLCFELPVLLTLLGRVGIIGSKGMREKRRYAIVGAFVAAAVLTPPDVISQVGLALPVILLYEISILSVRLVEKKRAQANGEDAAADDDEDEDDEAADEADTGAETPKETT